MTPSAKNQIRLTSIKMKRKTRQIQPKRENCKIPMFLKSYEAMYKKNENVYYTRCILYTVNYGRETLINVLELNTINLFGFLRTLRTQIVLLFSRNNRIEFLRNGDEHGWRGRRYPPTFIGFAGKFSLARIGQYNLMLLVSTPWVNI
jgi:hypothetical protein